MNLILNSMAECRHYVSAYVGNFEMRVIVDEDQDIRILSKHSRPIDDAHGVVIPANATPLQIFVALAQLLNCVANRAIMDGKECAKLARVTV